MLNGNRIYAGFDRNVLQDFVGWIYFEGKASVFLWFFCSIKEKASKAQAEPNLIIATQESSEEVMSILYSSSFKYHEEGLISKDQDFTDLNRHHYNEEQHHHNSGLMRYRSAPSSFLDSLTTSHGGCSSNDSVDYQYFRSSSPEMDAILSRFMTCNGSGDLSCQDLQEFGERRAMKQEMQDSQMVYHSLAMNDLGNNGNLENAGNCMGGRFNVINSMGMENSVQATKMSTANGYSLVRQHSSPADLFSNLRVDNGFTTMKETSSFQVSDGINGESNPSTRRSGYHLNFSSRQRLLPQIAETGDENHGTSSPEGSRIGKRQNVNFANDSWHDSSPNSFKRLKNNGDDNAFSSLYVLEDQNGGFGNRRANSTHHLSLPKKAGGEKVITEKYLEFQGSVPCKIRAKRGFATHPRSIAERVRRTRISERMRKLHDLFPNMDKQTNTADKLDMAVEYIKDLQGQVKALNDIKAKCTCTCSSDHKLHASA